MKGQLRLWAATKLPWIKPSIPIKKYKPLSPERRIIEPKFDGFRGAAMLEKGRVMFISKNGNPLYGYDSLGSDIARIIRAENAIIDGEIVSLDDLGRSNLVKVRYKDPPFQHLAFDLLWLNGKDLRNEPLFERKRLLKELLPPEQKIIQYVPTLEGDPDELFEALVAAGHEGYVMKNLDSQYLEGPELGNWVKRKRKYTPEERRARQALFSKKDWADE